MSKRNHTGGPIRGDLLRAESELVPLVQRGVLGLSSGHSRQHLAADVRAAVVESIDIDEGLRAGREQENRWDYLLGLSNGQVVGLEPHSAYSHEVKVVIKKKRAAVEQLRPHLRQGKHVDAWFWAASGGVAFADTEKARFLLDQSGIRFVGKQLLSKHLPAAAATRRR